MKIDESAKMPVNNSEVTEIFVIEGKINIHEHTLTQYSWIRIPANLNCSLQGEIASKIYVKIGKGVIRDKDWN